MIDISCSIVLYHNPIDDVRAAVESFLRHSPDGRLFLIDNSATDDFRYKFISPQVEYIYTGRNIGYGAAHNLAIRKIAGLSKYHLILNPDVSFEPSVLDGLFAFMQRNRHVGLVMPKVLYRNGNIQYLCKKLPSPFDLLLRRFFPGKLKFFIRKFLAAYELRDKDYGAIMNVPNLSGCFMFIRSSVFTSIGMFDERFFLYMEDTDLCRRINRYYSTVYYPRETIIHGYSKASYKSFRLMRHHLLSSVRYFNKWGWFGDRQRIAINRQVDEGNCFKHARIAAETQRHFLNFLVTTS